jgi:hypothetical protein
MGKKAADEKEVNLEDDNSWTDEARFSLIAAIKENMDENYFSSGLKSNAAICLRQDDSLYQ